MPYFVADGVRLSYQTFGQGRPVLMLHGTAASFKTNFGDFGWTELLVQHGLQVIALDQRGHGESDRPHDVDAYGVTIFASDALRLLDHLGLQTASVVGYSMGARVALELLTHHARRLERVALVATGDGVLGVEGYSLRELMAQVRDAISRTEYPADLPKHLSRYWHLVKTTGADRAALVAMTQAPYAPVPLPLLQRVDVTTLVVSGSNDRVAGSAEHLVHALKAEHVVVQGADHFTLAAFPSVRENVASFLSVPA